MGDAINRKSSGTRLMDDIAKWQQTFDAIPDLILVIDKKNKIVMANKAVEKKLSLERKDIIGKPCYSIMHCSSKPPSFCPHPQSLESGDEHFSESYEDSLKGYYIFSATPLLNSAGERIGTVEVARDISAQKQAEIALKDSESIFRAITESATDAIISADKENNIVLWNKTAEKMFGYSEEEAVEKKLTAIMPERFRLTHKKGMKKYIATGKSSLVGNNYEVMALRKDGTEFPVELSLSSWKRKDDILFTAIIRDATQRKKMEQELREASLKDELTGLLNRRGFMTLAEKQVQVSNRYKRNFIILYLDLNGMKQINDRFGHQTGDQALIDLADLLRKTFRSSDIISRIGGDEFTVLINEPPADIEHAIINNFTSNLKRFNRRSNRPYKLSSSLGFSLFDPAQPRSIDALLEEADAHMYKQKSLRSGDGSDESENSDTRKSKRLNIGSKYVAELIVSDSSMIRNVSKNGICVVTPYMLTKDNIYNIKIHSKDSEVCSLSGTVVWSASLRKGTASSSSRYETGLMFINLDNKRNLELNRFINNLSSSDKS